MKLNFLDTIVEEVTHIQAFDLTVLASGYESRCCDLALDFQKCGLFANGNVIVFAFEEHRELPQRLLNDSILKGICSRWEITAEKDGDKVEDILCKELQALSSTKSDLRVFVDISSMSRPWYAGVVLALRSFSGVEKLEVVFGYTIGQYNGPPESYPPSEIVCPVKGFCAAESPDRPTALVLGLGYDSGRGLGLREYLDPELTLVATSINPRFSNYLEAVKRANLDLFEMVDLDERFEYDIADPSGAFYTMKSLCAGLAEDWRVVLASVGPKLIGLIFFLMSVSDERLSVWRVSGGAKIEPRNVVGDGGILLNTTWI